MKKRSVKISGHETSISLEDEFWEDVKNLAKQKGISLNDFISQIDEERAQKQGQDYNLSSAIRLHVLDYYKSQAKG